ncbi:sucrase ferredoxin [Pseudonocardia alaniniphila]|uniref:Sucrase ferredoxin n=1 Tax=Pseudonocardia alaniniphila TaxID=75291 RepID=A0ABS9T9W0_9PSEU|nr:sucrase ferredoxin [Pseudonocardia alaniniphila]MCH6165329.1 sucrase ferredoxin [Pseudonocardia alaniniphila]
MTDGRVGTARCAVLARALGEPLAGTSPVASRWVCVEHRGAWPRAVAGHADPSVAAFTANAEAGGWRLLFIRRPGRRCDDPDGPSRVYFTDTAPGAATTTVLTVAGPAELADVPLPGPGDSLPGAAVPDPLLLVCTHGRRDRCCALDGRALATALTGVDELDVWECTHLGGHRFAPTALVLPTGYAYGRLDQAAAVAAYKAAASGEVETAMCRGRSTWTPAGQVAELAVRAATGLRDAGVLRADHAPGGAIVTARDGRRWSVDVAEVTGGARPASCGDDPVPSRALRAAGMRRLA